jgi:DNA-binding Lrp family transcriptional regulator
MKDHSVETDVLDDQIIQALSRDGRLSFKEIARDLGVADGTVRARTTRLIEAGLIRISAMRNPFAQERGLNALVGMELEKRTHRRTMELIAALPGVLSVANVTGSYDLVVGSLPAVPRRIEHVSLRGTSNGGRRPVDGNFRPPRRDQ